MKKTCAALLALIIAAAFAFAACTPKTTEELVAEYAAKGQSSLTEIAEATGGVLDVALFAEGKNLVYEYRYLLDFSGTAEALTESLDNEGSTFYNLYKDLAKYAKDESVSVIVRYYAKDGSKLVDYVIDKDYAHSENSSGFTPGEYASLEDFVSSDYFRGLVESNDTEDLKFEATVENGSTLVIKQYFLYILDEEESAELKASWDESMAKDGAGAIASMKAAVNAAIDVEGLNVVYRLYDGEGDLISTYPAD